MKKLLQFSILALLLLTPFIGNTQMVSEKKKEVAAKFIDLVQDKDWKSLSEIINYPLGRDYPIADIQNKSEFLSRRKEVFDDSLITMISNSSADSSDWSEIDSQEILFKNDMVSLDSVGGLISVNYQTEASVILKDKLTELDRSSLPKYLQIYERPILQMETEKFLIRIDELKGPSYRLIAWIQGNRNPNTPAVIIVPSGVLKHYGVGSDYSYTFKSEFGDFVCYISELKKDGSLPADLFLYRDGKLVRTYPPIWLTY